MSAFEFMGAHPILTFSLACVAYWVASLPFAAFKRWVRHLDISKHGWPTPPDMDADGDIIRPEPPPT